MEMNTRYEEWGLCRTICIWHWAAQDMIPEMGGFEYNIFSHYTQRLWTIGNGTFVSEAAIYAVASSPPFTAKPVKKALLVMNRPNRRGMMLDVAWTRLCTIRVPTYAHASRTVVLSLASRNVKPRATAKKTAKRSSRESQQSKICTNHCDVTTSAYHKSTHFHLLGCSCKWL